MLIALGGVLDRHEVEAIREAAADLDFADGRATAGPLAREAKRNEQAAASPALEAILAQARARLSAHPLFASAARPRRFARLLLSRYGPGMAYGAHVDDALMGGCRTDLSFTLFLSGEEDHDGGALVIEDALEERAIRLPAGDAILYPSGAVHRVEPVTRGTRLAIVGWVESWVRDPGRREALFDLDRAVEEARAAGSAALARRLAKVRSNLLRMWAAD